MRKSKSPARAKPNNPPKSAKRAAFKSRPNRTAATLPRSEKITTSVNGTSEITDLCRTKIWDLIRKGELETIHVRKRCLVIVASIHAFIERQAKRQRGSPPSHGPASLVKARKLASSAPAA